MNALSTILAQKAYKSQLFDTDSYTSVTTGGLAIQQAKTGQAQRATLAGSSTMPAAQERAA